MRLSGPAEVPPAPGGFDVRAQISLKGQSQEACWQFYGAAAVTGVTFAHIHSGAAGTSGPIVIPLSTGPTFKSAGCVQTSPALIKAIEANPKGYYVNIHSKKYPGGAVRSQL